MTDAMTILAHSAEKLEADVLLAAQAQVALLTEEIAAGIEYEFSPHTRSGRTLGSMRTEVIGLTGRITMRGGAVYIEEGTQAHGPKSARAMHFTWRGEDITTRWVRGVTRDPYLERALRTSRILPGMRRLAAGTFTAFRHDVGA